jgi:hypothetical protein
VPQAVATFSRRLSRNVEAALGEGRYAAQGTFSEPIDFAQRLYFAGAIVRETPRSSLLVTFRRVLFSGIPTYPSLPRSPDFTGSAVIVEQRANF